MQIHRSSRSLFLIMLGLALLVQPSGAFAQRRGHVKRPRRHKAVIAALPRDQVKVVVRGKQYFFSHGVFYGVGAEGYVAVPGPLGARIKVLPAGCLTVRLGATPLYVYYGTYYQYDPAAKEYVVISPPPEAAAPPTLDKVELVGGETVNGTYMGGTESTVQVQVNGNMQEIPVDQIVRIEFAPPAP